MKIYVTKNKLGGFYNTPIFTPFDKEDMKRSFIRLNLVDHEGFKKNQYNECDLYYVGEYDDVTGKLSILDDYEFLIDGRDLYTQVEGMRNGGK